MDSTPINAAPPIVNEVLRSPGQPLNAATRAFMESRFGHDFSAVRVHTDARAAESAQAVNAYAYTVGRDVMFGAGQYAPNTRAGQQLLAHELTHVVHQIALSGQSQIHRQLTINTVGDQYEQEAERTVDALEEDVIVPTPQRQSPSAEIGPHTLTRTRSLLVQRRSQGETGRKSSLDYAECSNYEPNEIQVSHTEAGHLERDVIKLAPGRLLIADFGVNWRHVKRSAIDDPLLQMWLNTFEVNDSFRLSIIGYSDCIGVEGRNIQLRQSRAQRVEGLLGRKARDRVTFRGMAALGAYVAENRTVEGRAKNRGVVIEFKQEFNFEPEHIKVTPKRCGPDVTEWLINQMNINQNHPVIKTGREHRWPRWVPGVNLVWTIAAFYDFAKLVAPGGPWDFKRTQRWWRAGGDSCPANDCDRTVTLCGHCVNYDVPGNIHFGWVGRRMEIAPWVLHIGAGLVQEGGAAGDDPPDIVAIDIGIAMADEGKDMCSQVRAKLKQLNLHGTENCSICSAS